MKIFTIKVERVVNQAIIAKVRADNEYKALEQVLTQVEYREDWINKEVSYTNMTLIDNETDRIDIGTAFY